MSIILNDPAEPVAAPVAAPVATFTPVTIVDMIDATAANARHIPASTPKVAGYVTGPGIEWPAELWALFPASAQVRIEQDPAAAVPLKSHVLDVESGAATPADVPGYVERRLAAGIEWSTIYGTDATLAQVRFELAKHATTTPGAAPDWYFGHVDAWLADWNLNRAEAVALVGTLVHGLTCRAVQWASPTSNPGTLVPGSPLTLAQALVDLSVAQASWPAQRTPPPPPPPPPAARGGWLLQWQGPTARPALTMVHSLDGGKTWE